MVTDGEACSFLGGTADNDATVHGLEITVRKLERDLFRLLHEDIEYGSLVGFHESFLFQSSATTLAALRTVSNPGNRHRHLKSIPNNGDLYLLICARVRYQREHY